MTPLGDARQRLVDALNEEHNPSYWGDEPRDAERLVNDFAHELAEQQRKNCQEVTCGPTEAQCACWDQADLIDPKVQTTGTS